MEWPLRNGNESMLYNSSYFKIISLFRELLTRFGFFFLKHHYKFLIILISVHQRVDHLVWHPVNKEILSQKNLHYYIISYEFKIKMSGIRDHDFSHGEVDSLLGATFRFSKTDCNSSGLLWFRFKVYRTTTS